MSKDPLATKHLGSHPDHIFISGLYKSGDGEAEKYDLHGSRKIGDLRYGTNPSQTAALYGRSSFLGSLKEIKTGKEGPSQTNMEDILYAALSIMYFDTPSVAIMKHENPSGFATQYGKEPLWLTYKKARDADFRAAFGGTVFINRPIDIETGEAIRELFTEVLVAPGFDEGVVGNFKGTIRIFEYDENRLSSIPKFAGDKAEPEIKRLQDESLIVSDPFLSPIREAEELRQYIVSEKQPTDVQLKDLLTGYRLRIRSNSIRLVKDGYTTGIGTGQMDRIFCLELAAYKNRRLADLAEKESVVRAADYSIPCSSLVSDGFFPQTDSIELAHELGIGSILAPHGGKKFEDVLLKANEFGMVFIDLPGEMRFFDHH